MKILFAPLLFLLLSFSNANAAPIVTSPASGSTLPQSTHNFTWSANGTAGISQWWLQVGSGSSFTNIYTGSQGTNTSKIINGLPINGSAINLRLWYRIGGTWQNLTFAYTSCTGCAPTGTVVSMISPPNGSTFIQPTQVFTWQATNGTPSQYWLFIGTTGVGSSNTFAGSQGINTQTTIPNLPNNGSTVFVRLWYRDGTWKFVDYTYTSCNGCTISPVLTMKKESFLISDPISGMSNPKNIPGAIVRYVITATNSGFGAVDANSIVINDSIPAGTSYEAGTLAFTNNTSGLNATAALNASVGNVQVTPQGTFSASNGITHPFFQVEFQVKIQ